MEKDSQKPRDSLIIGIDFGTSNCRAACQGRIIEHQLNERWLPSVVSFTNERQLIGHDALAQIEGNFGNTIFGVKKLIGRSFEEVKKAGFQRSFEVAKGESGESVIEVKYKGKKLQLLPEEVASIIIRQATENAESCMKERIVCVAISVPGSFNSRQSEAIVVAAKIAEVSLIGMIKETEAAAMAYSIEDESSQIICVVHLGGGFSGVLVAKTGQKRFKVLSYVERSDMGGNELTNSLVNHFAAELKQKYRSDIMQDKDAFGRLRVQCEELKKKLSLYSRARAEHSCSLSVPALCNGETFKSSITMNDFEKLNERFFADLRKLIKEALKTAKISKSEVTKVVPVGSTTRVPKVNEILGNIFGGRKISRQLNSEETVAIGTSHYATWLATKTISESKKQISRKVKADDFVTTLVDKSILEMISSAKERRDDDRRWRKISQELDLFEAQVYEWKRQINKMELSSQSLQSIKKKITETLTWIENFKDKTVEVTAEIIEEQKSKVKDFLQKAIATPEREKGEEVERDRREFEAHTEQVRAQSVELSEKHKRVIERCDKVFSWIRDPQIPNTEVTVEFIQQRKKSLDNIVSETIATAERGKGEEEVERDRREFEAHTEQVKGRIDEFCKMFKETCDKDLSWIRGLKRPNTEVTVESIQQRKKSFNFEMIAAVFKLLSSPYQGNCTPQMKSAGRGVETEEASMPTASMERRTTEPGSTGLQQTSKVAKNVKQGEAPAHGTL